MNNNKFTLWLKSLFCKTGDQDAKFLTFIRKDGVNSFLASVLSVILGMFVGGIIMAIVAASNENTTIQSSNEGFSLIFLGLFSMGRDASGQLSFGFNGVNIGNMLFRATPLIMTGLSVAVAYKTGLFNIGASGQYLMGTMATLYIALCIPTDVVPAWIVWILAFFGGAVAGFVWGAIPGIFKSLLNINEVITCIMTNWAAGTIVEWVFSASNLKETSGGQIQKIKMTSSNGVMTPRLGLNKLFPGSQVDGGIIIAIVIAIIVFIILAKTTFGYQLKACGSNRYSAKYAGIQDKRNIILSMAIAGALAGLAGSLYYLQGYTQFGWQTAMSLPAVGFNGIPVALLAANNPIGVIISAMLLSGLNIAGLQIKNLVPGFNEYITDVIIAIIVYFAAFVLFIKMLISGKIFKKKKVVKEDNKNTEVQLGDVKEPSQESTTLENVDNDTGQEPSVDTVEEAQSDDSVETKETNDCFEQEKPLDDSQLEKEEIDK